MTSAGVWITAIALGGLASCMSPEHGAKTSDPISSERLSSFDTADRTVFVTAARQKPRIAESLTAAGFAVRTNLLDARHLLRVTIGIDHGWSGCGTRNNVRYSLRRRDVALLELSEKGWTGTCTPNVFDALSHRLAEAFARER